MGTDFRGAPKYHRPTGGTDRRELVMAWPIKDNPAGCWKAEKPESCIDCYYSHVEGSTWHGSDECWNSECLVLDVDRLTPGERSMLHL